MSHEGNPDYAQPPAMTQQRAAPDQMAAVLVPVEPTPEMVEAGRAQLSDGGKMQTHARVMWVWEAMVQAAPSYVCLGVGDGSGKLFVHGDYDSIKTCQTIILDNTALRLAVRDLAEVLRSIVDYRPLTFPDTAIDPDTSVAVFAKRVATEAIASFGAAAEKEKAE